MKKAKRQKHRQRYITRKDKKRWTEKWRKGNGKIGFIPIDASVSSLLLL